MPQTITLKGVAFAALGVPDYTVGLRVLVDATFTLSDVNLAAVDATTGGPLTLTLTPTSVTYTTNAGDVLSAVTPVPVSLEIRSLQRVRADGKRTVRAAIAGGTHYNGTAMCTAFVVVGTILVPEDEGVDAPVGTPVSGGLYARYYNNLDLAGLPSYEVVETPNVYAAGGSTPHLGVSENWSTRWTGFLKVDVTTKRRFLLGSDDGCRMFFNGQTVVDDWSNSAGTRYTGFIDLVAGEFYAIWIEHFDGGGDGGFNLNWQESLGGVSTGPVEQVPGSVLYASLPDSQPVAAPPIQGAFYIEDINRY